MKKARLYLAMLSLVSVFAIQGMTGCTIITDQSPDTAELGEELDGTQWKLISLDGSQLVPRSYISLYFRENGKIWGFAGCNYFGGDYTASSNGTLGFSELTITLMGCTDEDISDQEKAYLDAITAVASCSLEENHLEMYDDTGRILLVFEQ
ncbi:MAG: META domain-containing protein, partial [Dehalococcoidales bacterium]|nr:META domain-containing protein [Dehalococcoidales bacterium]